MTDAGYGWIAETVSMGIADVSGVIQRFMEGVGNDPCQRVLSNGQTLQDYEDSWADYLGDAGAASASITQAQNLAFSTWGESTATDAEPFVDVLYNAGAHAPDETDVTVPAVILAMFTLGIGGAIAGGAARENWSRRLYEALPAPGRSPPGTNNGYQLAPGIYLWAGRNRSQSEHLELGVISGWRARELYWSWKHTVEDTVGPSNWPNWASDMGYLTGSALWKPGDPLGGYLGELEGLINTLRSYQADTIRACEEQTAWTRGLTEAAIANANKPPEEPSLLLPVLLGGLVGVLLNRGKRKGRR